MPKNMPGSSLKTKEPEHPTQKGNYNKAQGDSAEANTGNVPPGLQGAVSPARQHRLCRSEIASSGPGPAPGGTERCSQQQGSQQQRP